MNESPISLRPVRFLSALISTPVLWLVALGMCCALHLSPKKRQLGRRLVQEWGGWGLVPISAAMWAWKRLLLRPYAVLLALGVVGGMAVLLGGVRWVPLAWAVGMVAAMVLPAIDDELVDLLVRTRR